MKKTISIFLFSLLLLPMNNWASECSNPKPEWVFYSCWTAGTGTSDSVLRDGGKWDNAHYAGQISVVNNPPAGAPEAGNAFRIDWIEGSATACDGNGDTNNFAEKIPFSPALPNPFYMRFYFWSADLRSHYDCGGRKFLYVRHETPTGNGNLFLATYGSTMRLFLKNMANEKLYGTDPHDWNHRDSNHYTSDYPWPGQESPGILSVNTWHCIEFAEYRHDTAGWFKVWLDGKLVFNVNAAAFDAMGDNYGPGMGKYNTNNDDHPNWVQVPSYWNGGSKAHVEYLMNFIASSSYIGPIGGGTPNPPPNAPTGLKYIP